MLFNQATFIGVDPTAGQEPFVYAALDHQLRLLALAEGEIDEVMAFIGGQQQALVGVNAPRRLNQGLMADESYRSRLSPPPRSGRYLGYRVAEYELRQQAIHTYRTPRHISTCPRWIQVGFRVYQRLEGLGYRPNRPGERSWQYIEVYPHACFCVWLKAAPLPKKSLEGRIQRQLALFELGVELRDPMTFFEEITRHRLLMGTLPEGILFSPAELDALAAAYMAWITALHPDKTTQVGDPTEGEIVLPTEPLRSL
jgi:hypothetical protein